VRNKNAQLEARVEELESKLAGCMSKEKALVDQVADRTKLASELERMREEVVGLRQMNGDLTEGLRLAQMESQRASDGKRLALLEMARLRAAAEEEGIVLKSDAKKKVAGASTGDKSDDDST
jgi:hypothetical protein